MPPQAPIKKSNDLYGGCGEGQSAPTKKYSNIRGAVKYKPQSAYTFEAWQLLSPTKKSKAIADAAMASPTKES